MISSSILFAWDISDMCNAAGTEYSMTRKILYSSFCQEEFVAASLQSRDRASEILSLPAL